MIDWRITLTTLSSIRINWLLYVVIDPTEKSQLSTNLLELMKII